MKKLKFLVEIIQNFCSNTNLHGFSYISQPSRWKIERIFWIFSIVTSFILTGILIHKLRIESQNLPVVIYTDQNILPVTDINFPSVSLCPGFILSKFDGKQIFIFDYKEMKLDIEERQLKINSIKTEFLKKLQVITLIARDPFSINITKMIPTDNFTDQMEKAFLEFIGNDQRKFQPNIHVYSNYVRMYSIMYTRVLWKDGFCYTFNYPNSSQIYHLDRISHEFNYTHITRTANTLADIQSNKIFYQAPLKGHSSGAGLTLELQYNSRNFQHNFSVPRLPYNGLNIFLHEPFETISNVGYLRSRFNYRTEVLVMPVIFSYDDSFAEYGVEIRQCYLPNERSLNFFKVYNRINCEHECLAQMTLHRCSCVQFFMVRNETTRVCGIIDEKCFYEVEKIFEEGLKRTCKCYDSCERIKYDVEFLTKKELIHSDSEVNIKFKVDYINKLKKRSQHTFVEFLSLVGGFLGLFAGVSVLSAVEVSYFFIIYPMKRFREQRSLKVYPFSEKSKESSKQNLNLLEIFCLNSSIHGLSHAADGNKTKIERLLWTLSLIISLILSYFIIKEVFEKLRSNEVLVTMEGSSIPIEQIPFPAVTFVGNLPNIVVDELDLMNIGFIPEGVVMKHLNSFKNQVFSMICVNQIQTNILGTVDFEFETTSIIVDYLRGFARRHSTIFKNQAMTWNRNYQPILAEILTPKGFGMTFNMIEMKKLLNMNETSHDFYYFYNDSLNLQLPLMSPKNNENGLTVEFRLRQINRVCINSAFALHSPYELPINVQFIEFPENIDYEILITPEIFKSEDDLKEVDVQIRKCYFSDEKTLKHYKMYTQGNCEIECLNDAFLRNCQCLPFYFIRNSTIKVCDYMQRFACGNTQFELMKLVNNCKCLPACNSIMYFYEIREIRHKNRSRNATLTFHFKDNEYFARFRYRPFKIVDFLSYVGGIFGLFAGISSLSIVEIVYFFTLRLTTDLVRYMRS